jgi:hypothetical protein
LEEAVKSTLDKGDPGEKVMVAPGSVDKRGSATGAEGIKDGPSQQHTDGTTTTTSSTSSGSKRKAASVRIMGDPCYDGDYETDCASSKFGGVVIDDEAENVSGTSRDFVSTASAKKGVLESGKLQRTNTTSISTNRVSFSSRGSAVPPLVTVGGGGEAIRPSLASSKIAEKFGTSGGVVDRNSSDAPRRPAWNRTTKGVGPTTISKSTVPPVVEGNSTGSAVASTQKRDNFVNIVDSDSVSTSMHQILSCLTLFLFVLPRIWTVLLL